MAIAAVAAAARQFGRDDWLRLARDAYAGVARFRDGDRLPHAILGDKAAHFARCGADRGLLTGRNRR